LCFERASRRWILGTILFVHFEYSTAGARRSPAVFDSVIITGRNPVILFNSAGWFIQENN